MSDVLELKKSKSQLKCGSCGKPLVRGIPFVFCGHLGCSEYCKEVKVDES